MSTQPNVGKQAGRALDRGLDVATDIAITGAVAVTSVVLGGTFLEWVEPRTRGIPILHAMVVDVLAVWRKVYNP